MVENVAPARARIWKELGLAIAKKLGYKSRDDRLAQGAEFLRRMGEAEVARKAEELAARQKAEQEEQGERAWVEGEVAAALSSGTRFLRLFRRNQYWQDALIDYANAHQDQVSFLQFYGYYHPRKGGWSPPQCALLTLVAPQS